MFGKEAVEEQAAPVADLKVAGCGPGCRAIGIVNNKVVVIATLSPGCPVSRVEFPLPPGRVVSLSAVGPTAMTSDGALWLWTDGDKDWQKVGSLREEK